jgi:ubiquitin C-terminal hydrolase
MSKRGLEPSPQPFDGVVTPELRRLVYRLTAESGKSKKQQKGKEADPRDLAHVEAAAAKSRKAADAAERKALGEDPRSARREPGQRTGLLNLGATCYMNSLLQCLFMNCSFRSGIYKWQSAQPAGGGEASDAQKAADEVCLQLQRLFVHLQHSRASCYDPKPLADALGLNVAVQQDAQEFNKLLLSYLEDRLKLSPEQSLRSLVQDHFRGTSCYRTVCLHCQNPSASSATTYPFYELEVQSAASGAGGLTALRGSMAGSLHRP